MAQNTHAAQAAQPYDFARFTDEPQRAPKKPSLKVTGKEKEERAKKRQQTGKMLTRLALCSLVVALAFALLYTQNSVAALQSDIVKAQTQLAEEQALNAYLNTELEKMVNLRNIEERAAALGLVKLDTSKVIHMRVQESDTVQVRQSAWQQAWQSITEGISKLLGLFGD